jgi:ribosomal protein L34E
MINLGSKLGSIRNAAKKLNISYEEYLAKLNSGLKWCFKCQSWKSLNEFTKDTTRGDGYESRCFKCRSVQQRPGPNFRERQDLKKQKLAWCRDCHNWVDISSVSRGRCKNHWAEYHRKRYQTDLKYQLERKQHAHSRKRNIDPIPAVIQQELLREFNEKCAYCQDAATTWDHIIPISKGGKSISGNVVPCCFSCNSSKKDQDLHDWIEKTNKRNLHPKLFDVFSLSECH